MVTLQALSIKHRSTPAIMPLFRFWNRDLSRRRRTVGFSTGPSASALPTTGTSPRNIVPTDQSDLARYLENYYNYYRAQRYRHDEVAGWVVDDIDRSLRTLTDRALITRGTLRGLRGDIRSRGLVRSDVFDQVCNTIMEMKSDLYDTIDRLDDNRRSFRQDPQTRIIEEWRWMEWRWKKARAVILWCGAEYRKLKNHIQDNERSLVIRRFD